MDTIFSCFGCLKSQNQQHLINDQPVKHQNSSNVIAPITLKNDQIVFSSQLGTSNIPSMNSLKDKIQTYKERTNQEIISQSTPYYVASQISYPKTEARLDMNELLNKFLTNSKKKILILTGDAGAGKSTILSNIESKFLEKHINNKDWLPLRLSLAHPILNNPKQELMEQLLLFKGFSHQEIQALQVNKVPLLICLDAYDEAKNTVKLSNLVKLNRLVELWGSCKFIFTSRAEVFGDLSILKCFEAPQKYGGAHVLEHYDVPGFNYEQQKLFMQKYLNHEEENSSKWWESVSPSWRQISTYERAIYKYQLADLTKTPFLLQAAMQVLPEVIEQMLDFEKTQKSKNTSEEVNQIKLTQNEIIKGFIEKWFKREEQKLIEQGKQDLFITQAIMWRYASKLAYHMTTEQEHYFQVNTEQILTGWRSQLLNIENDRTHILWAAIPKKGSSGQEQWLHKSIMDYLVLNYQMQGMIEETKVIGNDQKKIIIESLNVPSMLNEISFLKMWRDTLLMDKSNIFQQKLLDVIELSKTEDVGVAAAIAISALNGARVSFSGMNLKGINVKGANLRNGIFYLTDLSNADLRNTNMAHSMLIHTKLIGAKMEGVNFGEYPKLITGTKMINSFDYSPDESQIAIGDNAGDIKVWDPTTGQQLNQIIKAHPYRIDGVSFNPNGTDLVSTGNDKKIKFWNLETGSLISEHTVTISDFPKIIQYSPNGTYMLFQGIRETKLIKTQNKSEINLPKTKKAIFSPDGNQLFLFNQKYREQNPRQQFYDVYLNIWDIKSQKVIKSHCLIGHLDELESVACSPDGTILATGSRDSTIRLWNANTGTQISDPLIGHQSILSSITFSPDNTQLASAARGNEIRLWDTRTGKQIGEPIVGADSSYYHLKYSLDGKKLTSLSDNDGRLGRISNDGTIQFWNLNTNSSIQQPLFKLKTTNSAVISPDKKMLAYSFKSNDKYSLEMAYLKSGKPIAESPLFANINDSISDITFSNESTQLAFFIGRVYKKIVVIDLQTKKYILRDKYNDSISWILGFNKNTLIVEESFKKGDHKIGFYHIENDKIEGNRCYKYGHTDIITSLIYSPTGSQYASASFDKTIRLWGKDEIKTPLTGHNAGVTALVYSSDGKLLISGSNDKSIRIWDTNTGKQVGEPLIGHSGRIMSLIFLEKKDLLISASNDSTIRFWNIKTKQQVQNPIIEDKGFPKTICFLEDCNQLVSCSTNNNIKFWVEKRTYKGKQWVLERTLSKFENPITFKESNLKQIQGLSDQNRLLLTQKNNNCAYNPNILSTKVSESYV